MKDSVAKYTTELIDTLADRYATTDGAAVHSGRLSKLFEQHVAVSGLPRIRLRLR